MYAKTNTHIHMYIHTHAHMYAYTYICTHIHIQTCTTCRWSLSLDCTFLYDQGSALSSFQPRHSTVTYGQQCHFAHSYATAMVLCTCTVLFLKEQALTMEYPTLLDWDTVQHKLPWNTAVAVSLCIHVAGSNPSNAIAFS